MGLDRSIFESMPVPRAILKSAVPAILGMVVTLIYNIADTYFIGQTGNPLQVAAVSLAMPVFLLFMATGNLIGIGGTSVISRSLGAKRNEHARHVSAFCFYSSIILGIVFALIFWLTMPFILEIIGASPETIEYARQYLMIVAPSAPFVVLSVSFSNIVRAEGKSKEAMMGVTIGTIVNIVLDPIMILKMDMGVGGAALATLIGNAASSVYYMYYLLRRSAALSIAPADFRIRDGVLRGVFAIGIPAALNSVLMSASNILMNNYLAGYGDIQIAAMGVAMKVFMIVIMLQIGLGVGVQPLLGYSFGARDYSRFRSIMKYSIIYSVLLGTFLTLVCRLGAGFLVRSFIDSEELYGFGVRFVKALLVAGPIVGIMFVLMNSIQAMGAARESLILSLSRQGIVFVPFLIIMNHVFGLYGIIYSLPAADVFTLFLAWLLYTVIVKRAMRQQPSPEETLHTTG